MPNLAETPVLYSFRRCPYAMRARMALFASSQACELREVLLRDKPLEMIEQSPKATVPVLVLEEGEVLEQSLDIMLWALNQNDPDHWLEPEGASLEDMLALIQATEGEFKGNLDRYKYANRYAGADPLHHRSEAEKFLKQLEARLADSAHLFDSNPTLADYAIAPFIRQFANTDRDWFDAAPYPNLQKWLENFLAQEPFTAVMAKYPVWQAGDAATLFGVQKNL
ncbi:MAG: glutathione S-transferase [Rhodospirillaceae bacterium]|jgi:glutathione S-transferase|nr:glutathione S-transferase [Rhodospirillaceae bacterium]MBT4588812.1 glutathione S-transferase [Rhodospirillaceae bacterium]MBT4937546.1 glutathione S-transferase [Rhodospirillaceae bacterium]MBT5940268.1 glutathione S-transferase [Rhodospirillaceae bacterium]MBT7267154.1 glutathione S-transferase [Rhodospirillaceae bacterium]